MSREWKPGDVVTATVKDRENVRLVAGWSKYDPQLRWCEVSPRWGDGDDDECWFMPRDVADHRRLVVIDPEDREAAGRLIALFSDQFTSWSTDGQRDADKMQAALREFASPTPPRPEEPTGLGAVVEDEDGVRHVRVFGVARSAWLGYLEADGGERQLRWQDITAVRVLSEGVRP